MYKRYKFENLNYFKSFFLSVLLLVIFFQILPALSQEEINKNDTSDEAVKSSTDLNSSMNSDFEFDNSDEIQTDITTKIYRSTDDSTNGFYDTETELDSAFDADIVKKEDLKNMLSSFNRKIVKRFKNLSNYSRETKSENFWLPWLLFLFVLTVLLLMFRLVKRV